ncbi:hypothetical protein PC118_g21311 [Phytophthora cactorum]|uniref:Uncharacterized protein n=1 Tax=Phytophthora cactorum TaxID=29920 RepID=A0A8T1F1M7_9STRA|nr:hypothetical protein PC118_g21311 [Phytophthora cactorum]
MPDVAAAHEVDCVDEVGVDTIGADATEPADWHTVGEFPALGTLDALDVLPAFAALGAFVSEDPSPFRGTSLP